MNPKKVISKVLFSIFSCNYQNKCRDFLKPVISDVDFRADHSLDSVEDT